MIAHRWIGLGALTGAAFVLCSVECSSPQKLGGEGDSCLLLTDCATNLLCVPTSGSTMECLADASALVKTEEAGAVPQPDGAVPPADGASPTSADSGAPPADEATAPPGVDSAAPSDAGPASGTDAAEEI